ncbi:MAG: hypothetical protein J6T86_03345 [Bacteroidales bacterium]|nr:hypothetical protein [Bacteroidales bacterium]
MATLFLKQSIPHLLEGVPEGRGSSRGKSSTGQVTTPKRSAVWSVAVLLMAVAFLMAACTKPEKKALDGTWRWTVTTGGIAGVWFTPESEGFEAELVFNGSSFTLFKDGEAVASGTYHIDYDVDETLYTDKGDQDEPFYSWFNIRFRLTESQHKKIAEAFNGKISLATPHKFLATLGYSEAEGQVFSMCEDGMYDGFCYTFVKK